MIMTTEIIEIALLVLSSFPLMMIFGLGQIIGAQMMKKPKVPEVQPIDVASEQAKALGGNIENYGLIQQLSDLANKTAMQQGLGNIDALLGKGTREQITGLLQSGLRGELPKDVESLIRRKSAETAGGQGVTGSQLARNLTLRDLGLTSLQRTDQALDSATKWLSISQQQIPQFNFGSLFVTPQQAIAQANINQQNQFQRDWLSNQLSAAYSSGSRWAAGLMAADAEISQIAASLAGSAGGALAGGK